MSELEREQFEAQRRERKFFSVFSCGGGMPWGLKVSGANFVLEEESFQALGILSQAKSATAIARKHTAVQLSFRLVVAAKLFETPSKQSLGKLLILPSVHSEKPSF